MGSRANSGWSRRIGLRQKTLVESAIDGQWGQWDEALKARRLRHLAQALTDFLRSKGTADRVNAAILKHGYRFENGDFVPVDASGQIST